MQNRTRQGFTLIELVMVVAVIAIIAALALSRLSGVQRNSAAKLNMANLGRIGSAIETYLAVTDGQLNRLDLIVGTPGVLPAVMGVSSPTGTYSISTAELFITTNNTKNIGIAPELYFAGGGYGLNSALITQYYLNDADVSALKKIGLTHLMRRTDGNRFTSGDDGEWATGSLNDPDTCFCVSTLVSNGLSVAVINPLGVSGSGQSIAPLGALIYQSCGQDVRFTATMQILVNGTAYAASAPTPLLNALKNSSDGLLLAFGLGQYASLIGNNKGGLDAAPICPVMEKDTYRRYFVLIRLKQNATDGKMEAQYAGIMDSRGDTMKSLRAQTR